MKLKTQAPEKDLWVLRDNYGYYFSGPVVSVDFCRANSPEFKNATRFTRGLKREWINKIGGCIRAKGYRFEKVLENA